MKESKDEKRCIFENAYALYEVQELTLNAFKSERFQIIKTQGKDFKILTLTQILQR